MTARTTVLVLTFIVLASVASASSGCTASHTFVAARDAGTSTGLDATEDPGVSDASTANGEDAPSTKKRVFITSRSYSGNLRLAGKASTGLEGADKLCNQAATAQGLAGEWRAWISDSKTDAIDRIADVGPWFLLDGKKAFTDKNTLAGASLAPIVVNEAGNEQFEYLAWTGTLSGGTRAGDTCLDWTTEVDEPFDDEEGMVGSGALPSQWNEASSAPCHFAHNLYCFEQ